MRFLRTNTAIRLTVGPFMDKADGVTPETALTVTSCKLTLMADIANVPTLQLDANATASGGNNDMVHVTGDDAGFYDLELTATNLNFLGRAMLAITDAATHCPVFHEFMVLPAMIYDSLVLGTDRLDTNTTHINDVATTSVTTIAAVLGTTSAPTITSGRVNADLTHIATAAVSTSTAQLGVNVVNFGGSAGTFASGRPAVNASYIGGVPVTATTSITFPSTCTVATTTGAVGSVTGAVGSVTGAAGSIATGGIAATSFAAGAINAAAIATGAIDADALAADAVTEIWAGSTAPSAATIADAVWDEDATGHQTQGTFGQAIGDPVADTNTIYKAVVTDATGATVGVDVAAVLDDTGTAGVVVASLATGSITAAVIANGAIDAATFAADVDAEFLSYLVDDATRIDASALNTASGAIGSNGTGLTEAGGTGDHLTALATAAELAKVPKSDGTATWNATALAAIQTEANDALVANRLDELLAADSDIDGAAPPTVGSVFHELMTKTAGSFTYDQTTDSLEAVRDRGDAAWITATGFSTLDAAGVRAAVGLASANLDTQLGDLPTNAELATSQAAADDATLAAIAALNNLSAAQVNAEVDAAIETYHLDHLLAVTYDPASKPGAADALLNELVESDAGVARYTANALEQAPTGGSAPTAAQIADEVQTRTIAGVTLVTTTTTLTNDPTGVGTLLTRLGTPSNLGGGATVAANLADIESQTDDIGVAGAGLTAISTQASVDAVAVQLVDILSLVESIAITGSATYTAAASSTLTTGSLSSGTYESTATADGVPHVHTDTGGAIEVMYQFELGASEVGVEVLFRGRVNSGNDTILVQAYDWVGADWETIWSQVGVGGSVDTNRAEPLLTKYTGTGANDGFVRIRFYAASGLSSATLYVDQLVIGKTVTTAAMATAIWANATRTLTAGTNIVLAKGTGVTGFNDLSAAQVNAEADTALSDVGLTTTITGRIDAAVSSRMATYTQPTGFLTATFPATVASTTNITAATGVVLSGVTHTGAVIPRVTLVDTTTTNTDMRGTDSAALAATALSTVQWTNTLATNLGTTNSTVVTNLDAAVSSRSTLTQTQVTGGAYSVQSSSCVLGDARIANLDAAVSSRSTYAGGAVASVTGSVGSVLGGINTTGGTITTLDQLDTAQDTQHGTTQTAIADLPTNAELTTALGTADDAVLAAIAVLQTYVDTEVAAIKAKTDSLTFTVAGQVDANIQYVNDTQVDGTGATGNEWGPV